MRQGLDPSRLSPVLFAALFAALFALAAVPILITALPPLVDYPNHLARMELLACLPGDPVLQQFYASAWRPIPDLAMDLTVPPLLEVLPLELAGRVFLLASFLLMAGGAALLQRVLFGCWSAWSCLAFLLLYGRILLWGFVNYLFGLGLALCALAGWIALASRAPALRLGLGAVFALALYFAHLMALGVYGVLVLGYEAAPLLRGRWRAAAAGLGLAALTLAPPILLLLAAGSGAGLGVVSFTAPWRKLDLLFSVFDLYHRPLDIACFAAAVGALGLAYWRRWLVLAPAMVLPLALLALAYLVMPSQMLGASGVDRRLPLALALALCGAGAWVGGRRRTELAFLAAAGAMLVLRLGTVAASWQASDRAYHDFLAGLDRVPEGSRIAVALPPDSEHVAATPLLHLPVLAAARRDAFVPTLFALPGQQPIVLQPAYRALAERVSPDRLWQAFVAGGPPLDGPERAGLELYDYVIFAGVAPFALGEHPGLIPAFLAPRFQLYRLHAPGG